MKFFASFIVSVLLLWNSNPGHSQSRKVDSLQRIYYTAYSDISKLNSILAACEEHHSMNRDTLYEYAVLATHLSQKLNNKNGKALSALALANSYLRWGWTDSALAASEIGISHCRLDDHALRSAYFRLARLQALCYGGKSNFAEALDKLYKLIDQGEKYRDSIVLATNMNTIGSISIARSQYREALNWLFQSIAFCPSDGRSNQVLPAIFVNTANAYYHLNDLDSATYYINRAVPLSRRITNLNTLATALRVQSNISIGRNRLADAEIQLQEMIAIRRSTGDGPGIVDDNLLLVDFYLKTRQPEKGIRLCNDALLRGNLYGDGGKTFANNVNIRLLYFEALAKCYKATGNDSLYQSTLEQIIAAKDSFYHANSAQAIAELQTKYEVQKIENALIQQRLDLTKKNYLFYGSLLLTILASVITVMIFRSYRRKQKLRLALMQQEEKRMANEAVKTAQEAERKRIAADLHDNLGAYAASIDSNIDQIKLSPSDGGNKVALTELRSNSKAIVSQLSDTIWVLKKDALSLTAISDRLKMFIQKLNASYPRVQIDVVEEISVDHLLPAAQAFHLFKILQEAINNSLRHSGCTAIQIIIEGNERWKIEVRDDGRGFNEDDKKSDGNGLENMKARSRESGWNIHWANNFPSGTVVDIAPTTN